MPQSQRTDAESVLIRMAPDEVIARAATRCDLSPWGNTELGMLGRYSDEYVAQITGRSLAAVKSKRSELQNGH